MAEDQMPFLSYETIKQCAVKLAQALGGHELLSRTLKLFRYFTKEENFEKN